MRRSLRRGAAAALCGAVWLVSIGVASAHEAPEGSEWVMADWMLLSWVAFFSTALLAFLVAVRRGLLRNVEQAKYHILTIKEEDYYTPEWIKDEEERNAQRP